VTSTRLAGKAEAAAEIVDSFVMYSRHESDSIERAQYDTLSQRHF
jgi:hypothetical protein